VIAQSQIPQATDSSRTVNPAPEETDHPEEARDIIGERTNTFRSFEFLLSLVVIIFGILIIGAEVYLAKLKVIESDQIFKVIIVTLIIIAGLILITAGYTNNQINGITGILGSIAGYLLAKGTNPSKE